MKFFFIYHGSYSLGKRTQPAFCDGPGILT